MSRETRLLFSRQVRRRDIVVQFGLGRFAVILPNQDASDAQRIAERLKRLLEKLDPAEEIEIVAAYETLTFHPGDRIDDYVGQVLRRSAG
jgi:GGDEF domain-containing protein